MLRVNRHGWQKPDNAYIRHPLQVYSNKYMDSILYPVPISSSFERICHSENARCAEQLALLIKIPLCQWKCGTLFLSSHVICPPDDPSVYGTATHFTDSKNRELADAIELIIEMESK